MENPMSFKDALSIMPEVSKYHRRLKLDELEQLVNYLYHKKTYTELGVYYGLSAGMIGLCTNIMHVNLYDLKVTDGMLEVIKLLSDFGVSSAIELMHIDKAIIRSADCIMIDAEHSYEATKRYYIRCTQLSPTIILHDIEMPGPKQVFDEYKNKNSVTFISDYTYDIAPDGKRLPPLGYGVINGNN